MKKHTKNPGPLVLLDRDGTLTVEVGYPKDPKQVRLLPGVPAGLRQLTKAGFVTAVVTNQSGVGRGLITLPEMHRVNRRFLQLLRIQKSSVDGLYWCPHRPERRCACRKPKLGLARRAAKELKVAWKGSISVGDRWSDVQMGQRTGGRGVLVLTGYGRQHAKKPHGVTPDHTARTFLKAVAWVLKQKKGKTNVR